jgi:hypothetical protein
MVAGRTGAARLRCLSTMSHAGWCPYRGAGPIGMRHPGAAISGVTCRLAKSPAGQQLAARGMRCHYRESKRIPPGPHEHSAPAPIRIVDDNHNKAMGNASAGRAARREKRAGSTTGAVGDRRTGCAHVVGHRRARGGTGSCSTLRHRAPRRVTMSWLYNRGQLVTASWMAKPLDYHQEPASTAVRLLHLTATRLQSLHLLRIRLCSQMPLLHASLAALPPMLTWHSA